MIKTWQHFAQPIIALFANFRLYLRWAGLAFLICLSAVAGALLNHLRAKASLQKREGESTVAELEMLRAAITSLPDPIYVKDLECRFVLANQAAADNMGAANSASILGKTDYDFFPDELAAGFFEDERKVILSGQPQISKEEIIEDPNGQAKFILSTKVPLLDAAGKVRGIVGVGRNITALKTVETELRRVQDQLKFEATHDSLTALLNRGAILEMFERERARSLRENGRTVIMLGDLDHFKNINDAHGHPTGDDVLRGVACRLLRAVRPYDLVGRFGGEEFLVILPGRAATNPPERADQLRRAISASPISTCRGPIRVTISIGVLVAEEWGKVTSERLLQEVDNALYAAKEAGRNLCRVAIPPPGICSSR